MEGKELVQYMRDKAERMQNRRQAKQKQAVEDVLKDLGLRREDSEKRLLRQLLEPSGDFALNRETPQHNVLMQVQDI